ncbi:hypothetical protein [Arthrobacter sp. ISL-69]|uniref:hypothetical protein n=1 Tax=Arthrobacter sp. ISL-69 TaxID=2819113 RepID=UPI001BE81519|nr:hypothetical protein [Arthrobacter sp. ISL-69]MBT2537259.1 hypothetical protein [Arthrobacter sp. ISL-69]
MTTNLATCSILTSDLNRLDADRRAERLESMNKAVRAAADRNHKPSPWDTSTIGTKVEAAGPVTTVSAFISDF